MRFTFEKKDRLFLLLLLLVHLLGFLAAVWIWKRPYSYDSAQYIQLATNLRQGVYYAGNTALPVQEHLISLRPPVYSLFILLSWTLFGYQTWGILLLQNIISIRTCFLVRNTFTRLFPRTPYQGIYWLLIFLYPMQMVFANMIFCDILLQCFLMLYLMQLLLLQQDHMSKRFFYMSLWLILGVFTKPVLYPFLFLHAAYCLWYCIRSKKISIALTAALPLCLVLLYGSWNKRQTGIFHISSVQSLNMLEYNVKEYYLFRYGPGAAKVKMDAIADRLKQTKSFKEHYALSAVIAREKVMAEPLSYTGFHLLKSLQLFFDPNKLEFDIFSRQFHYEGNHQASFFTSLRQRGWRGAWSYLKSYPFLPFLLLTPLSGLIRLLGFVLFISNRKNSLAIRMVLTLFVLYFALITGPVANARYFLPIMLVTSACAWLGYAGVWTNRKIKKTNLSAAST